VRIFTLGECETIRVPTALVVILPMAASYQAILEVLCFLQGVVQVSDPGMIPLLFSNESVTLTCTGMTLLLHGTTGFT
jgi:hypothetical protein